MMNKTKKDEVMIDPQGNEIPIEYMDPNIVTRSKLINSFYEEAIKHRLVLKDFKQRVRESIRKYLNEIAAQHGEKFKGNTSILNFSQDIRIEISMSEFLRFDERLQIAKQKVDQCITAWSKGSSKEISVLVTEAFQVDKEGNVDPKRILKLRQYKFDDPLWKEAMELITDSITVSRTKEYIKFKRKDRDGKWVQLSLNWSLL